MQVNIINHNNSVVNNYLADLRDVTVQSDPLRFRRNLQRIGAMMAYEVSRTLDYSPRTITTPLDKIEVSLPSDGIVVGSILRAGMPMHEGVLDVFDRAENCFVSAYRKYTSNEDFEIDLQYVATPNLDGKILLLCDPMLATGSSLALTYQKLKKYGTPKYTHIMSIIGAQPGVDHVCRSLEGEKVTLWIAAVDPALNAHKYIVPGLGDAGDLAYGEKL